MTFIPSNYITITLKEHFIIMNYLPSLDEGKYHCPRCNVYSSHRHYELKRRIINDDQDIPIIELELEAFNRGESAFGEVGGERIRFGEPEYDVNWNLHVSICIHCLEYIIWENRNIIFPFELDTPQPAKDMPAEVKDVYEEARLVYKQSPRSSAALLRLAIETLIPKLNYPIKSKSLYHMIGELVKQNIPKHIQKGLDVIRFHGNKGLHTAEINMQDDKDTVLFLFKLCNIIVEELITKEKEIEGFYDSIPKSFQNSVDKRDRKTKQ